MGNMIQGIYQIRNLINGKVYIGSSRNIRKRLRGHKNNLNKNIHTNMHLQSSWNKYGKDNFMFEKIEDVIEEKYLLIREQWYLDNIVDYGSDYNINPIADKHPSWEGKRHSDETKKKMADSQRGEKGHMWGKHPSIETRAKLSKSRKGELSPVAKLTDADVIKIREMYSTGEYFYREIALIFNVDLSTIASVVKRKTWKHI